jgi:hypothetical protein
MRRYEVLKVITYWRRSAQSNEKVGWMLRDHVEEKEFGCTTDEAWNHIHEFGAINAEARVKETKSRKIKTIEPLKSDVANFHQTSWQLKYEDIPQIECSATLLTQINEFIRIDEKWKIKLWQDSWHRKHKELISDWKTHQNILKCIDLAREIQEAKSIHIYVGAAVWQEVGLKNIYAEGFETETPLELEYLFARPIQEALTNMDIAPHHSDYSFIELPYVFQFLKTVQTINDKTEITYEVEPGVFRTEKDDAERVIVIGADIPSNVSKCRSTYFISHEMDPNEGQDCIMLHGPITQILKEVDRYFVKKGSKLCNVCGQKVAHGVGSSSIAPVTIAVCYSCASRNAEPYGVIVTKAALGKKRTEDYRPGPYFNHVIHSTLDLLGINKDRFHRDVDDRLDKLKSRER